tara:strand:- start:1309 stop:2676 length:1368 start_codon:yes stop_codon:yes gene_type:complete
MATGTDSTYHPSKVPIDIEETVTSAETLMKAGHWGQAIELLTLNLEKDAEHAQSLNTMGLCFYRLKNYDEAMATFDRLVEIAPQQFAFQLNKSLVLLKVDRLEEAKAILHQVLDQDPEHQRANAIMGLVLEQMGEYPQAMSHYEKGHEENRLNYLREISLRPPAIDAGPEASDAEDNEDSPPPELPAEDLASKVASEADQFEDPDKTAPELDAPLATEPAAHAENQALHGDPEILSNTPAPVNVPKWATSLRALQTDHPCPTDLTQTQRLAKDILLFPVQQEAYVRLATTSALIGALRSQKVMRQHADEESNVRLGGQAPLTRLLGNGAALLFTGDSVSNLIHLQDETLHLMEDTLLAFSSGLSWRNHALSGPNFEIDMVALSGTGLASVATSRDLLPVEVTPKNPVQAHASQVVAWTGEVVPTLSPFSIEPEEDAAAMLFEGTGCVWILADLAK